MSDENTFDFALYLGTTTPLDNRGLLWRQRLIMDVHGAGVKDDAALASHLHGFSRDHDNGAGSIMEQHHFTSNGSRPVITSVDTPK